MHECLSVKRLLKICKIDTLNVVCIWKSAFLGVLFVELPVITTCAVDCWVNWHDAVHKS